jgi:hypothetical protein
MSDPTQITERAGVTRTPREDGEGVHYVREPQRFSLHRDVPFMPAEITTGTPTPAIRRRFSRLDTAPAAA